VVAGDGVQELREHLRVERARTLLDEAEPEVNMAEKAPLLRLREGWPGLELPRPSDVVQECGGQKQVSAKAGVQLRRLAAERGHADGVLEESARVSVVSVDTCRRQAPKRLAERGVLYEFADERRQPGVGDLLGQELEEAVELGRVATEGRRQLDRIGLRSLERAHLHLEPLAETLDPSEHSHRVPLVEASVEELDVVPDARLDPPACIGELEREEGSSRAGAAALLLRDREDAFDDPILGELGDRRHGSILRGRGVGTLAAMADVQPFRAVRYSGAAGPLADLVAPPYDTVTGAERSRLFAKSPYNVVRLTLPDSVDQAATLYRRWLEEGILVREPAPGAWLIAEEFVGPDGIARERHGVVVSVAVEPYSSGAVLPHERTRPRIREERLRLLESTRVQLEPIFLLSASPLDLPRPERDPDLRANGARLWRVPDLDAPALAVAAELLIADGHHRYESALAFAETAGPEGARMMALLVSTEDPGLQVFPTHRIFRGRADLGELREGEPCADLENALERLADEPRSHAAAVAYRRNGVELVRGHAELDVELVDRHGLEGIEYTPVTADAVAAVDWGEADVAFLVRAPRIGDVFATARSGKRMPPKSTYFFPKPLSGLLFHPVDS
jgi:uncharacterized protein (DUF1015 family)